MEEEEEEEEDEEEEPNHEDLILKLCWLFVQLLLLLLALGRPNSGAARPKTRAKASLLLAAEEVETNFKIRSWFCCDFSISCLCTIVAFATSASCSCFLNSRSCFLSSSFCSSSSLSCDLFSWAPTKPKRRSSLALAFALAYHHS